jgi:hypothetical protein
MDAFLIPVFVLVSLTVSVLFLALLLYAIPVRSAITVIHKGKQQEQVLVISWGIFGIRTSGAEGRMLTEVRIAGATVLSHTGSVKPEKKAGNGTGIPETGPRSAAYGNLIGILPAIRNVAGPVGSFGSAFWRQSRFVGAKGTVTLGLGDPALTGEVCGMYWASRFVLLASRIDIDLNPVFDRAVLEMDITVRMKVKHPLLVLLAGFRLAWQPAMREALGVARRQAQVRATA